MPCQEATTGFGPDQTSGSSSFPRDIGSPSLFPHQRSRDTGLRGPRRHFLQSLSPASESLPWANPRVGWDSTVSAAPRCLWAPFLPVAVPLDPPQWLEMSISD